MLGKKVMKSALLIGLGMLGFYVTNSLAANDIAGIANTMTGTFKSIGQLMAATAYLAGFGLTIAAIFKFKQHKDNPQTVTMGVPITMLLVGIALIFLPNIIQPAGTSIFGSGATTGGFSGNGISIVPGAS